MTNSGAGNGSGDSDNPKIGSSEGGHVDGSDVGFGFQREEFGQGSLVGTVQIYDRHVFLCYNSPEEWPSHVEAAAAAPDGLPGLLSAAMKARKGDMKKRTRLTICEGEDGTDSSNGNVLIFPDMIRYRKLTHLDIDNFVEEVLVKDGEWLPQASETLTSSYVFVCSHGSRDRRCGVCGPPLIKKFKEEISVRSLQGQVCVSACSHIGGHKYAGNVIIYSPNVDGEITGHWYGYVDPVNVPVLLEQHIQKGEVVAHLWRGQMGLSEEDQKKAHELRLRLNGETVQEQNSKKSTQLNGLDSNVKGTVKGTMNGATGCCQGIGNSNCCQNQVPDGNLKHETQKTVEKSKKGPKGKASTWFRGWEMEDTYAVVAIAAAIVSLAAAYGGYRKMR